MIVWNERVYADFGYPARAWIIDLLRWIEQKASSEQKHRLLGLLLGYSPDAIAVHDEAMSGHVENQRSTRTDPELEAPT